MEHLINLAQDREVKLAKIAQAKMELQRIEFEVAEHIVASGRIEYITINWAKLKRDTGVAAPRKISVR